MPSAQHDNERVPDCLTMGSCAGCQTSLRVQSVALRPLKATVCNGTNSQISQLDRPHARLLLA